MIVGNLYKKIGQVKRFIHPLPVLDLSLLGVPINQFVHMLIINPKSFSSGYVVALRLMNTNKDESRRINQPKFLHFFRPLERVDNERGLGGQRVRVILIPLRENLGRGPGADTESSRL